jgi:release factor glutamine methyltransferase
MLVREALLQGTQLLEAAGISAARLTAEVLLMHATGHDRSWLYAHATDQLSELWWIHYGRYLHERMQGKPSQYIVGQQEFYGRVFRVGPGVLIPRPETEGLIEAALAHANAAAAILDIGTGSGAIAVTLALEAKTRVTASDVSLVALAAARRNAAALEAPVNFVACDLGSAFAPASFDLIVSNPPYVAERDRPTLQREVRDHEPALALFAGDDGLAVYRRLIPQAARLLRPGGRLILELGDAAAVRELLRAWHDVTIGNDLAGLPRVAIAKRP